MLNRTQNASGLTLPNGGLHYDPIDRNNSVPAARALRAANCSISVIVPTYRRPLSLRFCLGALKGRLRAPDEIVFVCRRDDDETSAMLDQLTGLKLPLLVVNPSGPGVVAAYNSGIEAASGYIVAITDDDAVAPSDWLARIEGQFAADSGMGGLGGRDVVYLNDKPISGRRRRVGVVQCFGRVVGNHHLGYGPPRQVDVLKGVNMSFRRTAIADVRFNHCLLGTGAQADCELNFCLALRRRGVKLIYDPSLVVYHFPAHRDNEDSRIAQSVQTQFNQAYNETITLLDHLGYAGRVVFMLWAIFIGTRAVPGMLNGLRCPFLTPKKPVHFLLASVDGRMKGYWAWRQRKVGVSFSP